MNMTKADYDELVRLRDEGFKYICKALNNTLIASDDPPIMVQNRWTYAPFTVFRRITNSSLENVISYCAALVIAAAIAEYERAKEGK